MSDLEKKVIASAAKGYIVDESTITTDTVLTDLSNSSLNLVAFLSNVEEELDVYINPRTAMGLKTVGDFVEFIKNSR